MNPFKTRSTRPKATDVFFSTTDWDSNLEEMNLNMVEFWKFDSNIAHTLYEKFPINQKIAAMYEIQKSTGLLFEEPFTLISAKSKDKSEMLRNAGNEKFESYQYEDALRYYCKSIAMAPKNSRELALAYSNRSLVLFRISKFKTALLDVNRALQGDCSESLKLKLLCRKRNCINEIRKAAAGSVTDLSNFRQLQKLEYNLNTDSTEPDLKNSLPLPTATFKNKLLPNTSEKIKLNVTEKLGTHFTATVNIKPGEILMTEKSFASILDTSFHCTFCYTFCDALIPCEGCSSVMFCSKECHDKAHKLYHEVECEYIMYADTFGLNKATKLCLRALLIASEQGKTLNELLEQPYVKNIDLLSPASLDPNKKFVSDYASICALPVNFTAETKDYQCLLAMFACIGLHVLKKSSFFDGVANSLDLSRKVYGDVTKAELLVGTLIWKNMFTLRVHQSAIKEKKEIKSSFMGNLLTQFTSFWTEIGIGLYPLLGHMKFSCDPNVARFEHGDTTILYALRPISANEQLYDTLGLHYKDCPLSTRKAIMEKIFHMKCECEACTNKWPLFSELPSFDINTKIAFKNNANLRKFKKDTEKMHILLANPHLIKHELKFLCEYSMLLHRCAKRPAKLFVALEKAIMDILSGQGNFISLSAEFDTPMIDFQNIFESCLDEIRLH